MVNILNADVNRLPVGLVGREADRVLCATVDLVHSV